MCKLTPSTSHVLVSNVAGFCCLEVFKLQNCSNSTSLVHRTFYSHLSRIGLVFDEQCIVFCD
uniref:Uncharacterized protein n=1 Tax=Rhizophora mucronata TaxID=61149 RepID=A0A2P2QCI1_RHIMU